MTATATKPASQAAPKQNGDKAIPPAAQQSPVDHSVSGTELLNELLQGRKTTYIPLAESQEVALSVALVKQHLCVPTRKGYRPEDSDCLKYIMMCRQRGLNPWVGDCYLLGYDQSVKAENGAWVDAPKFSMVVAIQALLKRAELSRTADGAPAFDGLESGVVVLRSDKDGNEEIVERQGDLTMKGETLLGGWAKVYRKDRSRPFYQRLKLETYFRDTKIWKTDSPGMICKNAEAGALRQAFPSDVGGLFLAEEIEAFAQANETMTTKKPANTSGPVDLETLSKYAAPQEVITPAPHGSQAASGDAQAGGNDEGVDPQTPDESSQEIVDEASDAPEADAQDELSGWRTDIDEAGTNGRLDQLVEEARQQPAAVRDAVMKLIDVRRQALKPKPKAGKGTAGEQAALPGT